MNPIDITFIEHIKRAELELIEGKKSNTIGRERETRIRNQLADFSGRVRKGIRRFLHRNRRAGNWGGKQ